MLSKFSRRERRGHENGGGGCFGKSWKSVYFAGVECA